MDCHNLTYANGERPRRPTKRLRIQATQISLSTILKNQHRSFAETRAGYIDLQIRVQFVNFGKFMRGHSAALNLRTFPEKKNRKLMDTHVRGRRTSTARDGSSTPNFAFSGPTGTMLRMTCRSGGCHLQTVERSPLLKR